MNKITLLQGLPASGKSTKAQEIVKASGRSVRLNKDLLREMLHFNKFSPVKEELTMGAELCLAQLFLNHGYDVVIDDTNLNPKVVNTWKSLSTNFDYKMEIIQMDTHVSECISRDLDRKNRGERFVGPDVIIQMAMQYDLLGEPKMDYVLCDLDGTLFDISHRLHYVHQDPKDWKSFFAEMDGDIARQDVLDILKRYVQDGCSIVFISARPDTYRGISEKKIVEALGSLPYLTLIMRRSFDHRVDEEVKQDILNKYFLDKSKIKAVIDDRPRVIRMWERNGLKVHDVGPGIEF